MGISVARRFEPRWRRYEPRAFQLDGLAIRPDDVDIVRGSHQITLGVDYIYSLMNTANNRPTNGAFTFSSGSSGLTGLGYADFLVGSLDSLLQGNPDIENDGDNYFRLCTRRTPGRRPVGLH